MFRENVMLALTLSACLQIAAAAQDAYTPPKYADLTKSGIEVPLKRIISGNEASSNPAVPDRGERIAKMRADLSKLSIERPLKRVITEAAPVTPLKEERISKGRVKPGNVHWHDSMKSACAAASHSGKPVLVFQMMGKLDQEFC